MKTKRLWISFGLNLLLVATELIGFLTAGVEKPYRYYTMDSNFLALVAAAVFLVAFFACKSHIPLWVYRFQYVTTCLVTVTFLVVVFVLAPAEPVYWTMFSGSAFYLHFLCPVLSLACLFVEEISPLTNTDTLWAFLPTVVYGITTIVLNLLKVMKGPYPFLLVYKNPPLASVFWAVAILGGAYLIAFLVKTIKNRVN